MFLEGLYNASTVRDFVAQLAFVLSERVLKRVRQGLYKTYREEYDSFSFVRGRIDMVAFCCTAVKSRIPCYSEDHTIDVEDNQIIAWTLHSVMRSALLERPKEINSVRKAELVLRNSVSLRPFGGSDCIGRSYNRLNSDYEILHKLCPVFLENMGPTHNLGTIHDSFCCRHGKSVRTFCRSFVGRKYRQEIPCTAPAHAFRLGKEVVPYGHGHTGLRSRDPAKLVASWILNTRPITRVSNDDYNQVVAYSDALGCDRAALVYPKGS